MNCNRLTIDVPSGSNYPEVDNVVLTLIPLGSVNTNPTNMVVSVNGLNEIICWPGDHTGWHLQVQTNSLAVGLSTNWVNVPGTSANSCYTNTIDPANGAVFYRTLFP